MRYLFLATALWHTLAAYYFLFRPQRLLRSLTHEEPVSPVAVDVLRFLGGLNLGYVALAVWGAAQAPLVAWASWVLALANGSQFGLDLLAHHNGRWRRQLLRITLGDGLFTLAHATNLAFLSGYFPG